MLEYHADVLAFRPQLGVGHVGQVLFVDDDVATRRPFEHVDAADEGRFAGAALADNAEDFAVFNGQVDAFEGVDLGLAVVGFGNVFQFYHNINSLIQYEFNPVAVQLKKAVKQMTARYFLYVASSAGILRWNWHLP